ncbi:Uu.00g048880.m01.CDS01 [Anthostomella pinea]|uniref:Uu.00g048880.m01.CDS01 n=1 Tax=Anthostomella pinea TaxID=933095 RepID=A0AAI8YEQ6_9PEZI|nr:Uu.00g048880.m01.CDS01 [Anthostomella pinea]
MGLQRSGSVKVADVRIPQRLLSTTRKNGDWNPHHQGQQLLEQHGPVQDVIRRRQRSSSAVSTICQEPTETVGRPRKTSDPITLREAASVRSSSLNLLDDLTRSTHEKNEPFPPLGNPFADYHAHAHTRTENPFADYNHAHTDSFQSSWDGSDSGSDIRTWGGQGQIPQRSGTLRSVVQTARNVAQRVRKNSIFEVYEKAQKRGKELERKRWVQILFEYCFYTLLLAFIYLVLVGLPLWKGAVYWMYWVVSTKFVIAGGWSIFMGLSAFYAFGPLFIFFEKEPPMVERPADFDRNVIPGVTNTALLIPCYKSGNIVGATLEAALKVFPPSHIFVIANGNSKTPLDNTEEVCRPYGVNHIWSPVGSKIVAQFVGCYAAKGFRNVLLIDDDCALPPNFPVVSERLSGKVQSIGYTIKSVGPNSSKGSWCQQAQDLEYKISGLQRALAGKMGSATFPHGAISLWNRKFLIQTFHDHPGFSVSEDWFFGHSCRRLGGRIKMCTSVFVETETPDAIFFSNGDSRGGFGEMTVFKQRFLRWNFFFVNGMWYNLGYILGSWKLGWWEIGAKIFVFQEVYETLLYLFTPFILPISFVVEASFCGYLLLGTILMYLINVVIFNEVHLRLRKERISWTVLLVYYMPYKLILTLVNVGSCYWSLYKYAQYFAKRHPKVIEDEKAVEVVMRLEEEVQVPGMGEKHGAGHDDDEEGGRRMFVTALSSRNPGLDQQRTNILPTMVETSAPTTPHRLSYISGADDFIAPSPIQPLPAVMAQQKVQATDFGGFDFGTTEPLRSGHGGLFHSASRKTRRRRTSMAESLV